MKPKPFDPKTDLAPIPFDRRLIHRAEQLKHLGLPLPPHVGCFVWDPEGAIPAPSPFPERVYFVLSMPRFLDIFGSEEAMIERLVWLPTWHQARWVAQRMGVGDRVAGIWRDSPSMEPGEDLLLLYDLLIEAFREKKK
jgi:hypothetical protein